MNRSRHSPQIGIKALSRNWLPDIMALVIAYWITLHSSCSFASGLQAASDYATPVVTSSAPFPNSQTFYPTLSYPSGFHVLKLEMPFPTSGQDLCSEFSSMQAIQPFKTTGFNPNWCQDKLQMRRVYLATPPGTPPTAGWPVVMLLAVQESQTDNQHYRQTPTSSPDFINRMIFSNNWSWPEAQGNPSSLPFSYGYYVRSHLLQGLLSKGIAVLYVMPWAQQADSTGYNLDDWAFWQKSSNMGPALTWNSANDKTFFENLFAQLQQHQLNGYQIDTDLKLNQDKGSQHQATNSLKGLTSQAAPLDLNNLFIMGYSSAAQMTSRLLNEFPTMQPIDSSGAQLPTKMPNIRGAIMVSGGSYLCYSDLQGTADNNLTCPDQVYNSGGSCCPPNITEPYYAQGTHKHPPVLLAQSSFDGYADHNASVFYKARMDQIAPGQAHMITSVTDQNVTHIFFPEMVIPTINFVLDHLSYNQKQTTTYPLSAKTSAYLHFIYPKILIGQLPDASYIDKNIALLYWPALHSLSSNQNLGSGGSTWQGNDLLGTAWEGFQHISNTRSSITNDSGWKMPLYNDIWNPSFFPQSTYASFISKYNPFNISAFTQQGGFKDNRYIEISSTGHDWFAYYAPGSGTFINLKHTLAAPNKISAVFQLYKQSQNQSSSSGNLNYLDLANYLLSIDHAYWTDNNYLQGQDFSNAQTMCQQDPQANNYIGNQDNQRLACLLYIASSMSPQHPIAKATDSISATSGSAQAYAINDYNDMGGYWDLFIAAYAQKLGYDTVQMTTQPNEDGGWMFELADIDLIQKSHQPLSSMLTIQHKSTRSGWHAAPDKPILSGGFDTSVPLYTCSQLAADGACAPNKQYPSGTSSWFGMANKGSCNPNIPASMLLCQQTPGSLPQPPGADESITWPGQGSSSASVDANGSGSLSFENDASDSQGLAITYAVKLSGPGTAVRATDSSFKLTGITQSGEMAQVIARSSSGVTLKGQAVVIKMPHPPGPAPSWNIQSSNLQLVVTDQAGHEVFHKSINVQGDINNQGDNQDNTPTMLTLNKDQTYQITAPGQVQISNGITTLNCHAKNITQSFGQDTNLALEYSCDIAHNLRRKYNV